MKRIFDFRRVVAVVTAMSLMISTLILGSYSAFAASDYDVWSGNAATGYAGGDGSAANPWQISNAEQLAYLCSTATYGTTAPGNNSKYYKLTADIYLNNVSSDNWYEVTGLNEWTYGTVETCDFGGVFDGNGHTIYGLYINGSYAVAGLFGKLNNSAQVKNLGISKSYINNTNTTNGIAGALAGKRHPWVLSGKPGVFITGCFVDDTVIIKARDAGGFIGCAQAAQNVKTTFLNCYSAAKVEPALSTNPAFMFVGSNWAKNQFLTIKNSYAAGDFNFAPPQAVLINSYTTYSDSSEDDATVVSADKMTGSAARDNMKLNFRNIWYTPEGKLPQLRIFDPTLPAEPEGAIHFWDGTEATVPEGEDHPYDGGTGTSTDPYLISNPEQLAYLSKNATYDTTKTKYFKLTDDIYINYIPYDTWYEDTDFLKEWTYGTNGATGSSNFAGVFDGDGHIIYGLYLNGNYATAGLFGRLDGKAEIKNLGISQSYLKSTNQWAYAGVIAGMRNSWSEGNGVVISNCFLDDTVTVSSSGTAGGFIGLSTGGGATATSNTKITIQNSFSAANIVAAEGNCSAFLSTQSGRKIEVKVNDSYSVGDKPFVNNDYTTYTNCYTTASITNVAGIESLAIPQMTGLNAYLSMTGLDFGKLWYLTDGTPMPTAFLKWRGTTDENYAGGNGSQNTPYLIETAEQLAKLVSELNSTAGKYYKLTTDIYLNNVSSDNWTVGANEWALGTSDDESVGFAGTLDGNGHTVYGIYIKEENAKKYSGLFPSLLSGAEVYNLGVAASSIAGSEAAGAIAGVRTVSGGAKVTLNGCFSDDEVTLKTKYAGGLIGKVLLKNGTTNADTALENCYSNAVLQPASDGAKGGVIGYVPDTDGGNLTLKTVYNAQSDTALVGGNQNKVKYTACYSAGSAFDGVTSLTQDKMIGDAAQENMTALDFANDVWYTVSGEIPRLSVFRMVTPDYVVPEFSGTISLVSTNETAFELSWPTAKDNVTEEDAIIYKIYLDTVSITEDTISTLSPKGVFVGSTMGVISGLSKGDIYYIAIAAYDLFGNSTMVTGGPFEVGLNVNNVWSGKVSSIFAGGNGTEENPYLISNGEQLALLAKSAQYGPYTQLMDKYYKITADIYLNDVSDPDWMSKNPNEWVYGTLGDKDTGIGNNNMFPGKLDGDGHVIHGIYINESAKTTSGLFIGLNQNAKVEKLGIAHSYIKASSDTEGTNALAGALAGIINYHKDDGVVISQCFADETVTVKNGGGLVGWVADLATFTDCYSGAVLESDNKGGIISSAWNANKEVLIHLERCFNARNGESLIASAGTNASYTDCYTLGSGNYEGVTRVLSSSYMIGEIPRETMPKLNYETVWETTEKGAPVLRVFGEGNYAYACGRNPVKLTISFNSNGGSEVDPIYGYAGNSLTLPTPERFGFTFGGWYVYKELDIKYPLDVFPEYSLTLYAKWIDASVLRQGFESYSYKSSTTGGFGEDYEYFRPGTIGYDPEFVYAGSKSVHRKGETDDEQDIQIFNKDDEPLEVGKNYTVQFMAYLESSGNGKLSLVCSDSLDVSDNAVSRQEFTTIDSLTEGKWQQITVSFTAKGKYLSIRTPGLSSIYFDNVVIYNGGNPSGNVEILSAPEKNEEINKDAFENAEESNNEDAFENTEESNNEDASENAEKTNNKGKNTSKKKDESNMMYIWITVLACGAVAVAVALVIILKRKRHKSA